MAHENVDNDVRRSESVEELVGRVDADALRAFVILIARDDEAFERELRSSFEFADAGQAAQELERVTESLWNRYERGGFITWRDSDDFEQAYGTAVRAIMRPFLLAEDADALIDLVVPRLVQLQRACVDGSCGFYTDALNDVSDDLNRAFELAGAEQSARLFEILSDFLDENPGKDYAEIYEYEQEFAMGFLRERFARDGVFAPSVIELANQWLDWIAAEMGDERGYGIYDRSDWAQLCLAARVTRGDAPDEVLAYAEKYELLDDADTVRAIADAYETSGRPREAAGFVRANLDAREERYGYRFERHPVERPRLVECLERLACACYDTAELAELYRELMVRDKGSDFRQYVPDPALGHWYDELRRLTDADAWVGVRAELLGAASYDTANAILAHEGSLEELYQRIMANDGNGLTAYESILVDAHPEPYVDYYLKNVAWQADHSSDRKAYNRFASTLSHAARIKGGKKRAQALATAIAAKYPRRPALLDELQKAGFEV